MAGKKITQSVIAKELGLSRITVSKVFNGSEGVSEETKRKVLNKAVELSYAHPALKDRSVPRNFADFRHEPLLRRVTVLCHNDSFSGALWTPLLRSLSAVLSGRKAQMRFAVVSPEEEAAGTVPESVTAELPDGIVLIGTFGKEYVKAAARLSVPLAALDLPAGFEFYEQPCDVVFTENREPARLLTERLIARGHKDIAFVGPRHMLGFSERYRGYRDALEAHGLRPDEDLSFMPDRPLSDFTAERIYEYYARRDRLPTAFVCVNDLAVNQVYALTRPPFSLFENPVLCGFDHLPGIIPEDLEYYGVHAVPEELGAALAEQILWRIENPGRPPRTVRIRTELADTGPRGRPRTGGHS